MRPRTGSGVRAVVAAAVLTLVAVPFGLLLFVVEDRWDPLLDADTGVADALHRYAVGSPALVHAMQVVSTLGGTLVWTAVVVAVAGYLVRRGRRRPALFVVVTIAGGAVLNTVVKQLVHRARPVLPDPVAHASGLSFPSGHAQSAVVGCAVLLLVFLPALSRTGQRLAVAGAVAMVLLTGFARLALGVHYLSDVLAGYALGAAWVVAMAAAFRRQVGGPPTR